MAAIATKKMGGDVGTQLTFPAIFQNVYASQYRPLQYAPSTPGPLVVPMAGDDFQSHYHAQKKRDADYMAMAKVFASRNAERRMLLGHQNYYGMPAPSLVQREFANPSQGAYITESSRRDGTSAPFQLVESSLTGGVLRTAEGQAHGKARLLDRIKQLDVIDAEKLRFSGLPPGEMPSAPPEATTTLPPAVSAPVTENAKIELQIILKSIIDALMGGKEGQPGEKDELSRFTFSDSVRALSLVIRVASSPDTDAEKLEDVKAPVDNINQLLSGLTDPDRMEQVEMTDMAKERLITTAELFKRIGQYVDGMMGGINLSPRERLALSKNLVKTLGFTQFARDMEKQRVENRGFYERVAKSKLFDARGRQSMDDEDDDDDDDRFDSEAATREDTEQGTTSSRSAFTSDERQTFGYASGAWFDAPRQEGREAPAFLGEERPPLEQLGEEVERSVLQPAPPRSSRMSAPSSEIRSVYDPVLGARGVEVVRRGPSSAASAKTAPKAHVRQKAQAIAPGVMMRIPGTQRLVVQGREVPQRRSPAPSTKASTLSSFGTLPSLPSRRRSTRAPSAVGAPAAAAPSRSVASRRLPEEPPLSWLPTKQPDLPLTREGLEALAKKINAAGGLTEDGKLAGVEAGKPLGKSIAVYSKGTLENIRRNFVRRLKLEGKY